MANTRASVTTTGGPELRNLLRELPRRVERKGNRAAVTSASVPILRGAKARAKRQSGLLKKSIGRKVKTYRQTAVAVIGARRNVAGVYKGRRRVPANYIHLVAKGTTHSRGDDFLGISYRSNRAAAEQIAAARFKEVVEREAVRLGKR